MSWDDPRVKHPVDWPVCAVCGLALDDVHMRPENWHTEAERVVDMSKRIPSLR